MGFKFFIPYLWLDKYNKVQKDLYALFSLIYPIREMSRKSSHFEDSGEIIFHQKSREIEEMSWDEIHFPNVSSPKVSPAPKCSENTNELLLKAIEAMNRDVASIKQNLGEILNKENSFGEQLLK